LYKYLINIVSKLNDTDKYPAASVDFQPTVQS